MALAAIAPTGKAFILATSTSTNVLLPQTGTPTQLLVQNLGDYPIYVLLGTSNAVVVTTATGLPIQPRTQQVLTLGSNTYLAAIGQGSLDICMGN